MPNALQCITGVLAALAVALSGHEAVAQSSAQPPSDAEIAAIVLEANDIDVAHGKMAKKMASNSEVKAFAERMIKDHQSANRQVKDLAKKLNVEPKESAASEQLEKNADQTEDSLEKLKGAEFDTAYIESEVKFHQAVIDTVDKSLLPNAKNLELKTLIQDIRPTLEAHLEHAKRVQAMLRPS